MGLFLVILNATTVLRLTTSPIGYLLTHLIYSTLWHVLLRMMVTQTFICWVTYHTVFAQQMTQFIAFTGLGHFVFIRVSKISISIYCMQYSLQVTSCSVWWNAASLHYKWYYLDFHYKMSYKDCLSNTWDTDTQATRLFWSAGVYYSIHFALYFINKMNTILINERQACRNVWI